MEFIFNGSTLICATNSSLIVDSIELLDSDGQIIIAGPSRNVSIIHHNLNGKMMSSEYICRVNSTLGSQNISIFVNSSEAVETNTQSATEVPSKPSPNTQSATEVPSKQSPTTQSVIPIAAASAGALLILLSIIFILVCIISLR